MKREDAIKNTMKKITKSYIDKMPIPEKKNGKHTQKIYRDGTLVGFAIKISSTGIKTFIIDKRVNNKLHRIIIGKYGVMTVEEARKQAQKYLGQLAVGIDPNDRNQKQRVINITLFDAFEAYSATRKNLKERTRFDYRKIIERDFSDWGCKPITKISSQDVIVRHAKISKRTPMGADNAFKLLQAIFNYAKAAYKNSQDESIININPVNVLSETRAWHRKKRRNTIIKIEDLPAWYQAVMELKNERVTSIATTIRDYLIAVLFTGDRKSEMQAITWDDNVDFGAKTLSFFDTKNRLDFSLPMSEFLCDHFAKMRQNSRSKFVFPNANGDAPFVNPYKTIKRVSETSARYTKTGKPVVFTIHDLRRTFITTAESLDISAYTLKRLLNHKMSSDVTAGYIITETERLRKPMERISRCLFGIIKGEFTSYEDF